MMRNPVPGVGEGNYSWRLAGLPRIVSRGTGLDADVIASLNRFKDLAAWRFEPSIWLLVISVVYAVAAALLMVCVLRYVKEMHRKELELMW